MVCNVLTTEVIHQLQNTHTYTYTQLTLTHAPLGMRMYTCARVATNIPVAQFSVMPGRELPDCELVTSPTVYAYCVLRSTKGLCIIHTELACFVTDKDLCGRKVLPIDLLWYMDAHYCQYIPVEVI